MKLEQKILLALARQIQEKQRYITGYTLAQDIGVERAQVYRCLKSIISKYSETIETEVV